jgi:hypothetical protein
VSEQKVLIGWKKKNVGCAFEEDSGCIKFFTTEQGCQMA